MLNRIWKYVTRPWGDEDFMENNISRKLRIFPPFFMDVMGFLAAIAIVGIFSRFKASRVFISRWSPCISVIKTIVGRFWFLKASAPPVGST